MSAAVKVEEEIEHLDWEPRCVLQVSHEYRLFGVLPLMRDEAACNRPAAWVLQCSKCRRLAQVCNEHAEFARTCPAVRCMHCGTHGPGSGVFEIRPL